MTYFIFDRYAFDGSTGQASFYYRFSDGRQFVETVQFKVVREYDAEALDRALFLAWLLIGVSYYKCFPVSRVSFTDSSIDMWQAAFLGKVYQEGMSQFAYENHLTRSDLAQFEPTSGASAQPVHYTGTGILALQSGGKDSLLVATLLEQAQQRFASFYISSSQSAPAVLGDIGKTQLTATRVIDRTAIEQARAEGGLNGHVPVTYIVMSLGLIQAILGNYSMVVVSIGHEGEEHHAMIGDLPVNHQWSKTWAAEQLFSEYVERYISPEIWVGSPIRGLSELSVSQLFIEHAWAQFGHRFSSCNRANYTQGADNTHLQWCGDCPKCANAYLLFAPFVAHAELTGMFGGKDLFAQSELAQTFKGLLGVDDAMKPFECIGEVNELRYAYHLSQSRSFAALPFVVPPSDFDPAVTYQSQSWARELIQRAL